MLRFFTTLGLFFGFAAPSFSFGADPSRSWLELKQKVEAGQWDEALQVVLADPDSSPTRDYNLGTLYLHQKQYGLSLAYLERAHRKFLGDSSTTHNWQLAKSKWLSTMAGQALYEPWELRSTEELSQGLAAMAFLLLCFGVRGYRKSRKQSSPQGLGRAQFAPVGFSLLGLVLVLALAWLEWDAVVHPKAIFISSEGLRSGAGERYLVLYEPPVGTWAKILQKQKAADSSEEWYQVQFALNGIAWVQEKSLLVL